MAPETVTVSAPAPETEAHVEDILIEDPRKTRRSYVERVKYFGAEAVERFDEQAKQRAAKKRARKAEGRLRAGRV